MKPSAKRNAAARNDVRLLPAVASVAAILLCLKAGGLAFDASAATAPATPAQKAAAQSAAPASPPATTAPATAAQAPKGPADPFEAINSALPMPPNRPPLSASQTAQAAAAAPSAPASDSGVSQAEMDVLTSLAGRRGALEERQRELELKASVIAAAEKRVDEKIAQLKALQTQIEALMGQREQRETQQLDGLVRIYSAMKPKDAARIFASLDNDVRINVAARMKADAMAGILSALPSDVAQKLTVELATRYKSPAVAAASATPPAPPQAAPAAPMP